MYFVSSLTEMSIFRVLNLVELQLRSASESIQPVLLIWVGLDSNWVRLMKRWASEPGLRNYHFNNNFTAFNIILQPRLMFYFSTNKTLFFFWQNTSYIRKRQVISGGRRGGVCTPCTLPTRSAPVTV